MDLKNKYWVLRHGRSIPNQKGLIVSHLRNGILEEHGLAPQGVEQARAAGQLFKQAIEGESISLEKVRIFCSPFSRTRDTAKEVVDVLKIDPCNVQFVEDLRERYFGPSLELQSHDHYPEIWALDECDPFTGPVGGESVADVAKRLLEVLSTIESECHECVVLIVSHGDPLQIFQTIVHAEVSNTKKGCDMEAAFHASILSGHRKYALLTGELRQLL